MVFGYRPVTKRAPSRGRWKGTHIMRSSGSSCAQDGHFEQRSSAVYRGDDERFKIIQLRQLEGKCKQMTRCSLIFNLRSSVKLIRNFEAMKKPWPWEISRKLSPYPAEPTVLLQMLDVSISGAEVCPKQAEACSARSGSCRKHPEYHHESRFGALSHLARAGPTTVSNGIIVR